jgi:glycosyltransferase involved in cell wall biosynthesis
MIWSGEISYPKSVVKRLWLRIVTQKVKGFLAYGTLSGKCLKRIKNKPIYYVWNTGDTEFYKKITQKIKKEKIKWKEKFKFQKKNNLGIIGTLVKRKGLEEALEIVKKVKEKGVKFFLHIIGDGPLCSQLKEKTKILNLEKEVKFWGHKSPYEVAIFLGILDLIIFPTLYDIWGLVINEALASGTPIVASKYAGAVEDLIKKNKEKIVFDPYKIEKTAEKIIEILKDEELKKESIEEGQRIIEEKVNLKKASEGFLKAILNGK